MIIGVGDCCTGVRIGLQGATLTGGTAIVRKICLVLQRIVQRSHQAIIVVGDLSGIGQWIRDLDEFAVAIVKLRHLTILIGNAREFIIRIVAIADRALQRIGDLADMTVGIVADGGGPSLRVGDRVDLAGVVGIRVEGDTIVVFIGILHQDVGRVEGIDLSRMVKFERMGSVAACRQVGIQSSRIGPSTPLLL